MPPRLRTLPERHGGRVVLGLLIAVLALGFALRVHAALTPPEDVGNDAAAYMAIAKGLYTQHHYGGPDAVEPERLVPGRAAALRRRLLRHRRRARRRRRCCSSRCSARDDPAHLPARAPPRRARGGPRRRALAATYPAFIENNGRLLAEPVALFWLPAAVLAFLWASDGGRARGAGWCPAPCSALTALTRPEYLPFVALFALLALAARVARPPRGPAGRASPRRRSSSPPSRRARALDRPQLSCLDRFVPVTTGGGKALFVATYLPGDGRQQLSSAS